MTGHPRFRTRWSGFTLALATLGLVLAAPGLHAYGAEPGTSAAAKPLRVGKGPKAFPDLQSAVNAASPGDRVLVTIDTCGARIDKPLVIQGTGGATVFGMADNPGDPCKTRTDFAVAIDLAPGASGTRIFNLQVADAFIGIVANIPNDGSDAADDIEIVESRLRDVQIGIHARRASGWRIVQNTITFPASINGGAAQGLLLTDGVDDWQILENTISGSVVGGGVFGIDVLALPAGCCAPAQPITDVRIAGNVIAVSAGGGAHSIRLAAADANIVGAEVTGNDLSGSDGQVLVQASVDPADTGDDLAGLHQYGFSQIPSWALVLELLVQGNLLP